MATSQQARRWARPEDWERARPIIKKLYKDEMRTLKEVMTTMQSQHHFHATTRMYKAKLKEWGIAKNLKANEALAIFHAMEQRQAVGKASQIILRGKPVDLDWMRDYIKKNRGKLTKIDVQHGQTTIPTIDELICRTPSPQPISIITTPKSYRPAEDLLRSIYMFADGAFQSGKWFLASDGVVRSSKGERGRYCLLDLWDRMDMASQLMSRSETVDLVRLLDPVFGYLVDIVREECPRSLPFILSCLEVLHTRKRPDLIDMFVRYITNLSANMLGKDHPQTKIWENVLIVFTAEHEDILERAFFLLINEFRDRTQQSGTSISAYNDYYDAVLSHKDLETQEESLHSQINAITPGSETKESACLLRYRHAVVVKDIHMERGHYTKAEAALDVLRDYGDWDGALALQTRADVRMKIGDLKAAEGYYREASRLVDNKSMYRDEGWISSIFENLVDILTRHGKNDEASKYQQIRLGRIESLATQKIEDAVADEFASSHGDPRSLVAETPADIGTPAATETLVGTESPDAYQSP